MKKIILSFILLLFVSSLSYSQSEISTEKSINYGNWQPNSVNGSVGLGIIPGATTKLEISQDYWQDWLRLVPIAQQQIGYWLFH